MATPQLPAPGDLLDDTILVAHDLSPADMVYFGFQLCRLRHRWRATSHTAILGRSLDLPSVIALHHAREVSARKSRSSSMASKAC
jgi:phosphotransferase system enzyme I (PtsI)